MAGGESLGNLYFDLGLDDKEFMSKLEAIKKGDFKIKVGVDSKSILDASTTVSKSIVGAFKKIDIKIPSINTKAIDSAIGSGIDYQKNRLNELKSMIASTEAQISKLPLKGSVNISGGERSAGSEILSDLKKEAAELEKISAIRTEINSKSISQKNKEDDAYSAKVLSDMKKYYEEEEKSSSKKSSIVESNANKEKKSVKEANDEKMKATLFEGRVSKIDTAKNVDLAKEALLRQKIQKEIESTALAHKRNEAFGTQSQSRIRSNTEFTNKTLISQRQIAMQLSNQFGTMFSIYAVESFVKKLAEVRGEFESQKIALSAILQNGQQANVIFEQIKNLSVESPFKFKDLVGYTKQLSAFQIPANELFDTMKRLADVSSGLGVGMDRVVLAFGQVRSASVLRGQELRQFSEMGIPMVQLLADKFSILEKQTVSTGDVFERISKRMVSFNDVKDIFDDMTGAGGKFYEMQEKQAKSLLGMMTNLQDAIDIALNDIGETNEGVLKGAVSLTTDLINNWQTVAKIVMTAVAAYGAYKTVMLFNLALNSQFIAGLVLQASRLTMITAELGITTAAQYALNTAASINPWTVAALAIGAVFGALVLLSNNSKTAKEDIDRLNKSALDSAKSAGKVSELVSAYDKLSSSASKSEEEQTRLKVVIKELAKLYPDLVLKTDQYGNAIDVNIKKVKSLGDVMKQNLLIIARQNIEEAKSNIGGYSAANRKITDTLKAGVVTSTVYNENGPKTITSALTISERKRLQEEYESNQGIINGFLGTIQNSADLINKLKGNADKAKSEMSDWANWAKNFKKQTDALNISKSISELFTQQNMEGGSAEFKSSLEKMYKDDLEQYKIYVTSKGLFSAQEISDLKKKVSDEKSALDILGGTKEENKKDKTDYVAEQLENQIKLVKNLYSEFVKLNGVQGTDRAKELISTSPEYKSSRDKLATIGVGIQFSEDKVNEEITKLIAKTKQTKKVKEIGASFASNIDKGFAEKSNESFENIFKAIDLVISTYKPKYDLYEKIFSLTGNSSQAAILAFGTQSAKDLGDIMKSQFESIPNAGIFDPLVRPAEGASGQIKKLWDDITEYYATKKVTKVEALSNLIEAAKTSEDKIISINNKAEKEIKETNEWAMSEMAGASASMILEIASIQESANKATKQNAEDQINEIRSTLFQLTPLYNEIFKDLGKVAAGNLDALLLKTNGLIELVKTKGEVKTGSNGETTGYFLKAGISDPNSGLKIDTNTLISVDKYNEAIERTNSIVNKINENPFKALLNPPKGVTDETPEERLKRIAGAIQGISDLAISVSGEVGSLMDSFGASDESKQSLTNIVNLATGAAQAGVGVAKLASGDVVGGIKDLASGIAKTVLSLNAMHDAKYEKQIKEYQKQIDATAKSYDSLTDSLSRKTAASKVDAQAEEYVMLQREKNLLEAQKQAEEAKKNTDQSKIDDYNNQIEEAAKKQQELALNTISYVLGGDIGSQADSWAKTLTDAMDSAFQNGTDAAQAWGDSVDNIVRDIAKNFIVNSFLGKQLQDWLQTASSDWTDADGKANQKNIEDDLKGFSTFAKSLEPATEAALKTVNDIYGTGAASAASSVSNGIKGITEPTADRLAGMINAIRQDSAVNRVSLSTIRDIIQSYAGGNIEANSYLQKMDANIRQNTLNTTAILGAIQDVTTNGANGKALKMA